MKKIILALMLLIVAIPFVNADMTLFEEELDIGEVSSFQDVNGANVTVRVDEIDTQSWKCKVVLGENGWFWVREYIELEMFSYIIYVDEVTYDSCDVKIRPNYIPPNTDALVRITAFKVLNVEPDNHGFLFVEEGAEVKFLVELTSDSQVNDLEWEFYNNGYPNGEGATKDLDGKIDLGVGVTNLEFSMVFKEDMDEIYNSGSFITVLIIDPDGEKTTTAAGLNFQGISIYTKDKDECYLYRDPAGNLMDAGVCEVTKKEIGRSVKKVLCVGEKEVFDMGDRDFDVVLTNELDTIRVDGKTTPAGIGGRLRVVDDFFLGSEPYSSTPYCLELTLGCKEGYCGNYETDDNERENDDNYYDGRSYELEEGESKNHVVYGVEHTVKLLIVEDVYPLSATFEIDGEVSPQMSIGDVFEGNNEFNLFIEHIFSSAASEYENDEEDFVTYRIENDEGNNYCRLDYDLCIDKKSQEYCEDELEECINEQNHNGGEGNNEKGNQPSCNDGCYVNHDMNKCLPFGTRLEYEGTPSFCDVDGNLLSQKEDSSEANNNYECKSNSARYGVCENIKEQQSAMKKVFEWLSRLFGGN